MLCQERAMLGRWAWSWRSSSRSIQLRVSLPVGPVEPAPDHQEAARSTSEVLSLEETVSVGAFSLSVLWSVCLTSGACAGAGCGVRV